MLDGVLGMIEGLTLGEKRELIAALKAAVARELGSLGPGEPEACPRCGCPRFVRKGRDRSGGQRWLCGGCGRTFGGSTRGLLSASKLEPGTWLAYVEGVVAQRSLRDLAAACGVSLKTAWFMRMRICEVMESQLRAPGVGPGVLWQVDGTFLEESLSGNRERSGTPMPRRAHCSGGQGGLRGVSNTKVCVVCGASDLGDVFCTLADRGRASDAAVEAAVAPLAGAGRVATDCLGAYERAFAKVGVGEYARLKAGTDEACEGLGLVNALHQRLKVFLDRFRGVATRRLSRYLSWFCWVEQTRRVDYMYYDTLEAQATRGRYRSSRAETFAEAQPFWSYWERKAVSNLV